jgi:TP901 family phage tail tape measure protein
MAGKIKGITIEIGGDTTKLQKSLSQLDEGLKKTKNELRDVNKLLRMDPKNTELLRQKQELLGKAVGDTEKRLEELNRATKEMEKSGITDDNREHYNQLKREIIATEQELKKLKAQQDALANSKLDNLSKQFDKVGKKVSEIGDNLTKKVTVPLVAFGTASMVAFKDVDKGMDAVVKKTGATGDQLAAMQASVKTLGTEIPADFEDIGNAVGEVNTRFGVTGQELEDMSAQFLKFAKVNDVDVVDSIDNTQKALAAFGMDASEAGKMLDVFTAVGQRTGIDMNQMTAMMSKYGAQLQAMGLDAYQAANFLGDVEVSGMDVAQSMTAMQKALKYASAAGKPLTTVLTDFDELMKSNASETEKLNAAYEIFGTKTGAAMYNAAKNGTLAFDQLGKSIDDNLGTLDSTFEGTLDATDDMKTTFNALKEAGYEVGAALGKTLTPILKKAAEGLRKFSAWFEKLSPHTKELITKLALLAAAAGPVLSIVGRMTSGVGKIIKQSPKLISGVKSLATALATNPYLAIAAAATAAAGAIAYLIYHQNAITREYEKSKAAREQEIQSIYAQAASAEIYAQKLDELMGKEQKSAADKQLIKTYVDQLNGSVEGLNLQYDAEADKLNQSTSAIYQKIDAYKQQAIAQAYQNQMQQVANDLVETEMRLDEIRTKKAETLSQIRMSTNQAEIDALSADLQELENEERQLTDKQNGLMNELDVYAARASGNIEKVGNSADKAAATTESKGYAIGANLGRGVASGLAWSQGLINDVAVRVVNSAISKMKAAAKIASPSKVTRDLIGKNLGLGVGEGLTESLSTVEKDAEAFMNGTINAMVTTPPEMKVAGMGAVTKQIGSVQSGPASKNVNQTINIYQPVSTPAETARAIRQQEIIQGLAG